MVVRDFLLKQSEIRRFAQVEIVMGTGIYREPSESTLKASEEESPNGHRKVHVFFYFLKENLNASKPSNYYVKKFRWEHWL